MTRCKRWAALAWLPFAAAVGGCAGPGAVSPGAGVPAERQIVVAVRNQPPAAQRRAGSTPRPYVGGAHYRSTPLARRQMTELARRHGLRALDSWPIELLELHCAVFEVPAGRSRDEVIAELAARPEVALVQPLHTFTSLAADPDPDADLDQNPDVDVDGVVSPPAENVSLAHRWATGRGVRVAVVDTGIDRGHPALQGRVVSSMDFAGRRSTNPPDEAHGTAVAGVIAAGGTDTVGTVGVAPDARLLALRACWHADATTAVCNTFTLARAIAAAVGQRAAVINLSLTGPADPLLAWLLERAIARGVTVIGAVPERVAEDADDATAVPFPVSVAGVIAVQSTEADAPAPSAHLHAPGRNVLTLRPGGGYGLANGSSFAAAHVSGVAALLLQHDAGLSASDVRELLATHARPVANGETTLRVVDACLSLAALVGADCPATAPAGAVGTSADAGRQWARREVQ